MTQTKSKAKIGAGSRPSRSLQKAGQRKAEGDAEERVPRPHLARQYARRRFAEELPKIFRTYSEAAIKGDIPSLKALISLSGFDREDAHVPPAKTRRGKSLAKLLLADLKRHAHQTPAEDANTSGAG